MKIELRVCLKFGSLWTDTNLGIKPNKRIVREKPEPIAVPEVINESWSMDFMHDYSGLLLCLLGTPTIMLTITGINLYTYLVNVLQRISQYPASKVVELTPHVWTEIFADNILKSDLDRVGL